MASYSVIDSKEQKYSWGVWPVKENVDTTLSLLNMGGGKVGLSYSAKYSGMKDGTTGGGPIEVSGNLNQKVHSGPDIYVVVSQYQNRGSYVSMHVEIKVDVAGSRTIYSQTLSGNYTADTSGWKALVESLNAPRNEQPA
jgi:hypothetical protein